MKKSRMKIGYARVSTEEQSLDLQVEALRHAGCDLIFTDHGVSGAIADREGLSAALKRMKAGDSLVVWKLDRLGRSLKFVIDLIEKFQGQGCGFVSLTEGFDTTTNTGMLVFHIIAAIGQFERVLISERTVAGLAAARRDGRQIGRRHSLTNEAIIEAHRLVTMERRPISRVAKQFDVSHDTLKRGFRRHGLAA